MTDRRALESLAASWSVDTSYVDVRGEVQVASDEALLDVLRCLGAPVEGLGDVPEALRLAHRERWARAIRPVVVAWDGESTTVPFRTEGATPRRFRVEVVRDGGEASRIEGSEDDLKVARRETADGQGFVEVLLPVPAAGGFGCHRLIAEVDGEPHEALLVAAPSRAWEDEADERGWGLFCPTYALRSEDDLGGGGLTELERLLDRVGAWGGRVVGTLPLLAAFLDEPCEPSPYAPVSRLFWNEALLDPRRLPELALSRTARRRLGSKAFGEELDALRAGELVEPRRRMRLLRSVLEPMAEAAFATNAVREQIEAFAGRSADADDYARFRAAQERHGTSWRTWRDVEAELADPAGEAARRYHLYVQHRLDEALSGLGGSGEGGRAGLYLDVPLGVHADGYDALRARTSFVEGCSAGAPPDDFFTAGQDWGFRPLHPTTARQRGYAYLRAAIDHQVAAARMLRIDHVMGLHRLFCIPHGRPAADGVYVRYPVDELYALWTLASWRHRCALVGEDLGTVPPEVRTTMRRRGIRRMWVMQFEVQPDAPPDLDATGDEVVASLNTHDMPTFAAFLAGDDVALREALGLLDPDEVEAEREARRRTIRALADGVGAAGREPADLLRAATRRLGASPARDVIVSLEDLWLEREPQNVPGTGAERPNWRRKARVPLESLPNAPMVEDVLSTLDRARKDG